MFINALPQVHGCCRCARRSEASPKVLMSALVDSEPRKKRGGAENHSEKNDRDPAHLANCATACQFPPRAVNTMLS
jgi:hypothetical protein